MEITNEEFVEWKEHPITKRLFEMLQIEAELARVNIVNKKGTVQERGESSIANGAMIEILDGL